MARGSKLAAAAATAASAGKRKKGRGRKISKAQKAEEAAVAAEEAAAEAEAAEARSARARNARQARTDGSVQRVNLSPDDLAACAEAKLELPVEQVALQKMRALKHGWVCALYVREKLHVYLAGGLDLAGGLEDDNRWIMEVMAGGKESEPVPVAKEQLESQHMVVMKGQQFFYVDTAGLGPFDGVGKGKGKGDCGCCWRGLRGRAGGRRRG
jgi:hypothetical protein